MRHGIKIADEEKQEMLRFCRDGPEDAPPPAWVDWEAGVVSGEEEDEEDDDGSSSTSDDDDAGEETCLPFLQLRKNKDGRKCRFELGRS